MEAATLSEDFIKLKKIVPTLTTHHLHQFYQNLLPGEYDNRFTLFLQDHFLNQKDDPETDFELESDFKALKDVFPNVPDYSIKWRLHLIGSKVRERKSIVVKLLLDSYYNLKRKSTEPNNYKGKNKVMKQMHKYRSNDDLEYFPFAVPSTSSNGGEVKSKGKSKSENSNRFDLACTSHSSNFQPETVNLENSNNLYLASSSQYNNFIADSVTLDPFSEDDFKIIDDIVKINKNSFNINLPSSDKNNKINAEHESNVKVKNEIFNFPTPSTLYSNDVMSPMFTSKNESDFSVKFKEVSVKENSNILDQFFTSDYKIIQNNFMITDNLNNSNYNQPTSSKSNNPALENEAVAAVKKEYLSFVMPSTSSSRVTKSAFGAVNNHFNFPIPYSDQPQEVKLENSTNTKMDPTFQNNNPIVKDVEAVELINEDVASFIDISDDSWSAFKNTNLDENIIHQPGMKKAVIDKKLYNQLMEIFPEASTDYLKMLCDGKQNTPDILNNLISVLVEIDYPKRPQKEKSPERDIDFEERYETLKQILPDADPTFLRIKLEAIGNHSDSYKIFISECLEKKNYPTMKEYLRKQKISAQAKQYTSEFCIEKFVKVIPSPEEYFSNENRKNEIKGYIDDQFSYHYAQTFLRNRYPHLRVRDINTVFVNSTTLWQACKELNKIKNIMKCKRKQCPQATSIQNIPLLQEIAYIEHQNEIETFINQKKLEKEQERLKAKELGLLSTCNCCFDDGVMAADSAYCQKQCSFCKSCVNKSVEILFGEGKLEFPCLASCDSTFSIQTLQDVLEPKVFSKIAQKKQLEEVKAAGIEELELCPFCDFATIPDQDDKIFRCLNSDCMKESCRLCKEPSHIPLKCDEVEKDDDVKRRVYIENKMTEALLRKCHKCDRKFIKEDGCNKMTCPCGATMCYVCGKAVKDYKHFNGQGGDQHHLCPLYSDTNELHKNDVLKGANTAKAEVGVKLKIDPTNDILVHYESKKRKKTSIDVQQRLENNAQVFALHQRNHHHNRYRRNH